MERLHAPLAALLNRGIADSVSARALCHELEGKSLDVQLDPPGLHTRLTATDGQLQISQPTETNADASLTGGLLGFNRLLFGDAQAALRSGDVSLSGDTEIAQQFQSLLEFARPEPEEELSRLIGDVAAHQIGEAARGFAGWAGNAADSFSRSVTEFLQEERRDLPTRYEVDEFLGDIDRLANDVERAAARLQQLRSNTSS
ncbi:MAG: ubiquinone biosynthesis accessory factor UbiJ [Gammaproteobacteria bacterium]